MAKMSIICSLAGVALIYGGALHMKANLTPISEINNSFIGLKTEISGRIIKISEHPDNHLFLEIRDQSNGVIMAPIFSKTRDKLKDSINLGDNIKISGKIEKYQGKIEILPQNSDGIKIIHTPHIRISNLDDTKIGDIVKIRGIFIEKVTSINPSFILRDRKDTILVEITDQFNQNPLELQKGDVLEVAGEVKPRGENNLKILVNNTRNVELLED